MDLITGLIIGFFAGATTVCAAALYLEKRMELRSRQAAVLAYAKQFGVTYEEADQAVITEK